MRDHFVLLVDRLLTESTLEAALQTQNQANDSIPSTVDGAKVDPLLDTIEVGTDVSQRKLAECRICQDEDFDSNMETPCSCCGSLKYAHRRCVQRWCNEKGNTVCEICHQQFRTGYTAPPPLFHIGEIRMNSRRNWEISRRGYGNPGVIEMVSTNRNYLDPEYDGDAASASRILICCRSFAVIFLMLLIVRRRLPVITYFSCPLFLTAGIILPIYVMVRVVNAIKRRRRYQEPLSSSNSSSSEEIQQSIVQNQAHAIHFH